MDMYRAEMGRASGWEDGEGEGKGGGMSGSREQSLKKQQDRSMYGTNARVRRVYMQYVRAAGRLDTVDLDMNLYW